MHFPRMFLKKIAKMSKSKNIESFPQNGPKNRNQTFESLCSNQYISSSNKVLTALFFPLIHFRVMTLYIICVENLQINMKIWAKFILTSRLFGNMLIKFIYLYLFEQLLFLLMQEDNQVLNLLMDELFAALFENI